MKALDFGIQAESIISVNHYMDRLISFLTNSKNDNFNHFSKMAQLYPTVFKQYEEFSFVRRKHKKTEKTLEIYIRFRFLISHTGNPSKSNLNIQKIIYIFADITGNYFLVSIYETDYITR